MWGTLILTEVSRPSFRSETLKRVGLPQQVLILKFNLTSFILLFRLSFALNLSCEERPTLSLNILLLILESPPSWPLTGAGNAFKR
jgi:hypothetical protein